MITIKEFCNARKHINYNTVYGRCYRYDVKPIKIDNSKHYPVHLYKEEDLIKIMERLHEK